MSVPIDGLTLVIRKTSLQARYPGAVGAYALALRALPRPPRFIVMSDMYLVSVGLSDEEHLGQATRLLVNHGLAEEWDGMAADFVTCDADWGLLDPCDWLELGWDDSGRTIAWLTGTNRSKGAAPAGMTTSDGSDDAEVRPSPWPDDEPPPGPLMAVAHRALAEDGHEFVSLDARVVTVDLDTLSGAGVLWIEADEGRPSLRIRIWLTVPWPLNPYNLSLWETVVLANSRLTHGAFRFNPDGSIEYDYTLRTMGQVPDPDALRGLIRECVAMVDRYCAAFESVALGFSYSSDAIPEVEWMSRAGHVHGTTAGFGGGRPIPDSYRIGSFPLFAGAYPYAGKPMERIGRIQSFLDAGIDTFIDLTTPDEQLPSYVSVLKRMAELRGISVRYHAHRIPAGGLPESAKAMRRILNVIDAALDSGHRVYVHCNKGGGRAAMVAGCYLVRHGSETTIAMETVQRLVSDLPSRREGDSAAHWSPAAQEQMFFVRNWRELAPPEFPERRLAELLLNLEVGTGPNSLANAAYIEGCMALRDRVRGALVGLAVGDALGVTNELRRPGTFEPVMDMIGGGRFNLEPGQWLDGTAMALCLAESLIERRRMHPADQLSRYVRWMRKGHLSSTGRCMDVGSTTATALTRFERDRSELADPSDPTQVGNGSLMRVAPVPLLYRRDPRIAIAHAGQSSMTTHASPVAVDACRYLAALMCGAVEGASRDELLAPLYSPVPGLWDEEPLDPMIHAIASGSFRRKNPPAIRGGSHCARSLEAALWAFHSSRDFASGALLAVNLGDDADTIGAIYGQLAGAFYGEESIPAEWRRKIALRSRIDELAEFLFQLSDNLRVELPPERKQNARDMVQDGLDEHGTASDALDAAKTGRNGMMSPWEFHGGGGSMGAMAAAEDAFLQLRVQVGLELTRRRLAP